MVDAGVKFAVETPLPTVRFEDLALTWTRSAEKAYLHVAVTSASPLRRVIDHAAPAHASQ